jgi:hypothetical protein
MIKMGEMGRKRGLGDLYDKYYSVMHTIFVLGASHMGL